MSEDPRPLSERYAQLLPQVAAGSRPAEAALVALLGPPIGAILRQRARGDEAIDDLRQEALMVVIKAAREGRIPDVPRLIGFAAETARRLAANAERLRRRRRTEVDHEAVMLAADDGHSVEQAFERPAVAACVQQVLATLDSERDRRVLHEYYLDERPTAQLQAALSVTSLQLSRILYRARQRFQAAWQAHRLAPPGD